MTFTINLACCLPSEMIPTSLILPTEKLNNYCLPEKEIRAMNQLEQSQMG